MGFAQPWVVFLGSLEAPERKLITQLLEAPSIRSRYSALAEPAAGAFAVATMAAAAGWDRSRMGLSDVSIFSAALGCAVNDEPIDRLQVRIDGEPLAVDGPPARQAATLLYEHLLLRNAAHFERSPSAYLQAIIDELERSRDEQLKVLTERVEKVVDRVRGARYRDLDLLDHLDEALDDAGTFIVLNPPTYRAGFEKMFDTGGRLEWAEPPYQMFDPAAGVADVMAKAADAPALLLCLQMAEPDKVAGPPVYARAGGKDGTRTYYLSNRPDEVLEALGGQRVTPRASAGNVQRPQSPLFGPDAEITRDTRIEVAQLASPVAQYLKELWVHRIWSKPAGQNFAVLLDGKIACIFGLDFAPMLSGRSPDGHWVRDSVLLTYSFGPAHPLYPRLTMLGVRCAMQRATIRAAGGSKMSVHAEAAQHVVTAMLTPYPEIKSHRGVMKLMSRNKDAEQGYRLVYRGDITDRGYPDVLGEWLAKEQRWLKNRAKGGSSDG